MNRLEFKFEFEKCHEPYDALIKMKDIIKEYGQVRVADLKELCGQKSTYTDNIYGWKELRTYHVVYNAASKKYSLHLPYPEQLNKGCTYDICAEDTVAAYCKADCLSTQNIILTKDKMDLESELEKVKKELEEAKSKVALWYTYAIGRNNLCCLLEEQQKEQNKELEEAQVLTTVLKKEIDNLKWEKTWYEAHYTEAKKNINELQEKLDNTTRSYSCVANNLYKKKKQLKDFRNRLEIAQCFLLSTQSGYIDAYDAKVTRMMGRDIKEFLEENKED